MPLEMNYQTSLLFLSICSFPSAVNCQCPKEAVPPCTCTGIGFHSSIVTCEKVDNEINLKRSLYSMRGIPIRQLQIFDSHVNFLLSDLFQGLKFERLFIAGCSFASLSDTEAAFEGLEDSLEVLNIQETTLLNGWTWSHLRNLVKLKEIRTIKAGPLLIDEDFKEIAHLNISLLQFTRDSLSFIHETAFSTFHNLRVLSLKNNLVSEIKRSMFPNPASVLKHINLSYNRLKTLPSDIFTNMPALKSITLGNNQILTLDKDIFESVWNQLRDLDVTDNLVRCDCRLNWLLQHQFPRNTWGKCAEPKNLKGKSIKDLEQKDLWC